MTPELLVPKLRWRTHFREALLRSILFLLLLSTPLHAEPPTAAYIFPAGGQRGTQVKARVGAHYLHDRAAWELLGQGVHASPELVEIERIWFEGPLIRQPASQQSENYPRDYAATIDIAPDAAPGVRYWRAHNAQGITPKLKFIVGHLPEVVEEEIDGIPVPVPVSLPITANGRIFPREDVDIWEVVASAGQSVTCAVAAAALESPLEAHLEVRDPQGKLVAQSGGSLSPDPLLRFVAKEAGRYRVHIRDSRYSGSQAHVYRLTITSGPWLDRVYPLGGKRGTEIEFEAAGQGLPEKLTLKLPDRGKDSPPTEMPGIVPHAFIPTRSVSEGSSSAALANASGYDGSLNPILLDLDTLDEVREPATNVPLPGIANGQIETPGDVDAWTFTATKGTPISVDLRAARLGSPLDGEIAVKDPDGKVVATADDLRGGNPDARLVFTPAADGVYTVEVRERFASRGGPAFAYRLRIAREEPDFVLSLPVDALSIDVGTEKKLPVTIERRGGFAEPIVIGARDLPPGITAAEVTAAPNQSQIELVFKVDKQTPVIAAQAKISGRAMHGNQSLERTAFVTTLPGEPPLDHLLIAATLPTPFRFKGQYEFRYVARGGTLAKTYAIERNGYDGPLEVRLADRQGRHLQGVTGPVVTIPAGQNTFDYTVALPSWMELGRTSRTNLMLTGEVADAAGKKHKVSFVTNEQNEQLIALVSPAPLRLSLARSAVVANADSELIIPVEIHRDRALTGDVKLELLIPPHVTDISAASITVAAGQKAELRLTLGPHPGPFTQPFVIRGTAEQRGGPLTSEVKLELIER